MTDFQTFYRTVLEVLKTSEEACLGVIQSAGATGAAVVELMEGATSSADALAYARALMELGRGWEAEEILRAVLGAELGLAVPLGSQHPVADIPQGDQILA